MKASWTKGLNESEATEMRTSFGASALMRDRLQELLDDRIKVEEAQSRGNANYNQASWPYKQADSNGYTRALAYVITLIKQEEKNV